MKRLPLFALLFIFLILTPIGLNFYYKSQLLPLSQQEETQIFVVKPSQSIVQIAQNLKEAGLIKNAFAFRLLVAQMGIGKSIQAGDFRLSAHRTSQEIAQELTHGAIDIWITFPEGIRVEEMADIIEAKLKIPTNDKYQFDKNEFISKAKEGYMFPDTYLIPKDTTVDALIDRLTQTFDEKVDPRLFESDNLADEEIITLASLIEREGKTNEEKPIIAGILMNRFAAGIALQVDATIQYAKGYDAASDSWWPQVSPQDYLRVKSLYNTYLHPGLPPTPIANPGINSIRAAANPADTPYFYYLHDSEGKIHYAKTIEEHTKNVQEFL